MRLLSFVAADPAEDIVRFAEAKSAGLLLLGGHRSVLGEGELGGVAGRVVARATVDVAVLVDRSERSSGENTSLEVENIRGVWVRGDEVALQVVVDRLVAAGVPRVEGPGPGVLLVASLGATVPEGVSALLVRPRRS